jgi:hypothetical protein
VGGSSGGSTGGIDSSSNDPNSFGGRKRAFDDRY